MPNFKFKVFRTRTGRLDRQRRADVGYWIMFADSEYANANF